MDESLTERVARLRATIALAPDEECVVCGGTGLRRYVHNERTYMERCVCRDDQHRPVRPPPTATRA